MTPRFWGARLIHNAPFRLSSFFLRFAVISLFVSDVGGGVIRWQKNCLSKQFQEFQKLGTINLFSNVCTWHCLCISVRFVTLIFLVMSWAMPCVWNIVGVLSSSYRLLSYMERKRPVDNENSGRFRKTWLYQAKRDRICNNNNNLCNNRNRWIWILKPNSKNLLNWLHQKHYNLPERSYFDRV